MLLFAKYEYIISSVKSLESIGILNLLYVSRALLEESLFLFSFEGFDRGLCTFHLKLAAFDLLDHSDSSSFGLETKFSSILALLVVDEGNVGRVD